MASADDPASEDPVSGDRLLDLLGIVVALVVVGALALIGSLIVGGPSDGVSAAPDAEWRLERINDTHVRIVHAGGEPAPTDRLLVTADGRKRHPTWSAEVLTEGDSGTFRASRARGIVRLWVEEGNDRELLARWEL